MASVSGQESGQSSGVPGEPGWAQRRTPGGQPQLRPGLVPLQTTGERPGRQGPAWPDAKVGL